MHTVRLAALSMKGKRKLEGVVPAMRHADRVLMLHRVRMDARMRRGARIKTNPISHADGTDLPPSDYFL
jgi:hypothetical protein